ncbi:hypothetical protein [Cupriavidus pauculus]|uniref:hypothetical protein n=1 Tax=Cupriavidus pauculus TaxID=82633 RepID=UPI001EE1D129|nr:hypothetical protein [Cupriavidus pauculus]GJG93879.1 hypothetical protein CBA19C6_05340 [Cupriavidus pauculus]
MLEDVEKVSVALENVFKESSDFIVIGLTGRTGSGCSTTAQILSGDLRNLPEAGASHYTGNEARKFRIVKRYLEPHWHPFKWLQVRSVITRYILVLSFAEFTKLVAEILGDNLPDVREKLRSFKPEYEEAHARIKDYLGAKDDTVESQENKKKVAYQIYFEWLPLFSDQLREHLKKLSIDAYTRVYQIVGDNIRTSGCANNSKFDPDKIFSLSVTINKVIKSARFVSRQEGVPCYIVIDAIRNPYEAMFLKERYADFHLLAVNTANENRLSHLRNSRKFSDQQILDLDAKEYPDKLSGYRKYTSQNIQKCIEIADIHVNNPRTDQYGHSQLRCQLAWYVSLMMHPGLIMPTSIESGMQIAYSVKHNSGCISRQVGAVVTDANYSVKAVGWNNSAQGQVPCLLRSADDLLNGIDEKAYSHYEKNDGTFRAVLSHKFSGALGSKTLNGRNLCFCFKDLQNEVDKEKNQVHTRSLHAEENAFLQISKYGGQQLQGGVLFTTASPCELCAKKAYQLGISKIVYIDPYPGIATSHVLSSGEHAPILELFRGAVGRAFHKLYQPIMPFKDELDMLLSFPKMSNRKEDRIKSLEDENGLLKNQIERLKEQLKHAARN